MENTMRVLVTGVSCFDGDIDGNHYKSAKVSYIPGSEETADNKRGFIPLQVKSDYSVFGEITVLPAIYEMQFDLKTTGKDVGIRFTGVSKLLSKVNFEQVAVK